MSMCCLRCESLHNLDDKQIGRSIQIDGIYLVIHTEHAHHMLADNMSHMPRPQQCLARRRLYAKISCRFLEAQQKKKNITQQKATAVKTVKGIGGMHPFTRTHHRVPAQILLPVLQVWSRRGVVNNAYGPLA